MDMKYSRRERKVYVESKHCMYVLVARSINSVPSNP